MTEDHDIHRDGGRETDRRRFMGLLAAGTAAAVSQQTASATPIVSVAAAAVAGSTDVPSAFDQMIKLRASLDPRPVYMWLVGKRYLLLPGGRSLPLCGMVNCSITRCTRKAPDAFDLLVHEYNYNTDFATGRWRDELVMPVTGRAVPSPVGKGPPVRHEWRAAYAYQGSLAGAGEFPPEAIRKYGADADLTIDRKVHPGEVFGDEIAFTNDWYLRVAPRQANTKGWWVRELSTVRGSLQAARDPREVYVPSRTAYSIVYDVLPWMQLDDVGGTVLTTASGGKTTSAAELPEAIREIFMQRNPEALGDPERLLRE